MEFNNRNYERLSIDSAKRKYYWLRKNADWNEIYITPKDTKNLKDQNMLIKCPQCNSFIKSSDSSLKDITRVKCFKCKKEPVQLSEKEEKIEKLASKFNDISDKPFEIEIMEKMVEKVENAEYIIEGLENKNNDWKFKVRCVECEKLHYFPIKNQQVEVSKCNHPVKGYIYFLLFQKNIFKIGSTLSIKNRMLSEKPDSMGILRTTQNYTNLDKSWFIITNSTNEESKNKHEILEKELHYLLRNNSTNIVNDSNGGTEYFYLNEETKNIIENWLQLYTMKKYNLLNELTNWNKRF